MHGCVDGRQPSSKILPYGSSRMTHIRSFFASGCDVSGKTLFHLFTEGIISFDSLNMHPFWSPTYKVTVGMMADH